MNNFTKLQATEMQYLVKLLLSNTQDVDSIPTNVESIKALATSLLKECDVLEREMYALSE